MRQRSTSRARTSMPWSRLTGLIGLTTACCFCYLSVLCGSAAADVSGTASAAIGPRKTYCQTCHPRERVEFETSVHHGDQVDCSSCHGGDPTSRQVEQAHRPPFTGRPARADVPELCARCHSDLDRMKPNNLPTDQYALYQTSGHGKLLAQGDERVAVCTDCHGVHDTRASADPQSRTNHRNVPGMCGECHDSEEFMAPYGGTSRPHAAYLNSMHAVQLLEYGNQKSPVCVDCHGVHGAAPPAFGDIHRVCGKCHSTTREHFLAGPHYVGFESAGLPECSSCHDHHSIDTSPGNSFNEVCADCHEEGSRGAEVGAQIEVLLRTAADDVSQADSLVIIAEAVPLAVADYQARLQEARTYLTEARPISHQAAVEPVEEMARRARSIAGEVESEVRGRLRDLSLRRFGLLAFWFYVLLTVAVLVDLRRREQS